MIFVKLHVSHELSSIPRKKIRDKQNKSPDEIEDGWTFCWEKRWEVLQLQLCTSTNTTSAHCACADGGTSNVQEG